ncbi:MAG: DUF481 domain-containing protein [Pseudomonadota bacterium]
MSGTSVGRVLRLLAPFVSACVFGALTPSALAADRIELNDGSVIYGSFEDADGGKVKIETAFAGVLEIDQSQIRSMSVESELVLQMEDGSILETPGLRVDGERLLLAEEAERAYALAELTRINPEPWELGNGYRFNGLASFAFNSQRGNTELDELDYRLELRWESLRDRIRFDGFGEVDEAQGVKNAENWTARLRYDRVQTGDWYWGGGATVEQDLFADLDLRTTVGPYLGRKFFTDPIFELEAETGLAYISEDFISGVDRDYVGSTWDVHINSNYLGGDSRLYLDHRGVWNLDEAENVVLNTTIGIAIPLLYGIEGAAEVTWDLNTGAVEGTEELDETYRLRIGYSW